MRRLVDKIGSLKLEVIKLSVVTPFAIILRLIFNILLGRKFGVSWQLDCFFISFALFGLLGIFNNFLDSLFIPIFNDVRKRSINESIIFFDVVMKWSIILSLVIFFLVRKFDVVIIKIIAPSFSERNIMLTKKLFDILLFALIFYNATRILQIALNAIYHYFIPSVVNLLIPLIEIASLFILVPIYGIKGIVIGSLFANFLIAVIFAFLFHSKTGWVPRTQLYHKNFPQLVIQSSKMALSGIIWNLRTVVSKSIASRLGEGAVTLFSYAERIIKLLIQTIVIPMLSVYYSRIAELVSSLNWQKTKALCADVLKVSMAISFIVASVIVIFLPYVLRILFLGSKFTTGDVKIISILVNILLLYFIIVAFESYISRIVIALKNIGIVTVNSVVGLVVLTASAAMLYKKYDLYSIAISWVLSQVTVAGVYYLFMRKLMELSVVRLIISFSKSFLIASVFLSIGLFIRRLSLSDTVFVFIVLPLWLGLYYIVAYRVLKAEKKIVFS